LPACRAPLLEVRFGGRGLAVDLSADAGDEVENAETTDQQREVDRPRPLRVDGTKDHEGQHREHEVRAKDRQ